MDPSSTFDAEWLALPGDKLELDSFATRIFLTRFTLDEPRPVCSAPRRPDFTRPTFPSSALTLDLLDSRPRFRFPRLRGTIYPTFSISIIVPLRQQTHQDERLTTPNSPDKTTLLHQTKPHSASICPRALSIDSRRSPCFIPTRSTEPLDPLAPTGSPDTYTLPTSNP